MLNRGRVACGALLAVAAACARIEPPPGGPPDRKPPVIVAVRPDSMAMLPGFDGEVEFVFDEVISEGGQANEGLGTGDLERLVLLSPTTEVPVVQWKRNRITVRPREGWQPGRVYRVQLLPGVSDIRNNRGGREVLLTFTTGADLPDHTLTGAVYDWSTGQPARGALLEAVLSPDSLVYRGTTDSTGKFRLGPLPRGDYQVLATLDQNRNLRREAREAFDSARVPRDSAAVPELWMFVHDSAPPRLGVPQPIDSTSVALPFNQKLDPAQALDSAAVSVRRLPDSLPVPVVALMTQARHDSLARAARPSADSLARARGTDSLAPRKGKADSIAPRDGARTPKVPLKPAGDSARAAIAKLDSMLGGARADTARKQPSRLPLSDRLVVRLGEPLVPGGRYTVEVRDIRNANGVAGTSRAGFAVPERPKPRPTDSTTAGGAPRAPATRDSAPPTDSTRRASDTVPTPPTPRP